MRPLRFESTPPPAPSPVKIGIEDVRAWFGSHRVLHGIQMQIPERSASSTSSALLLRSSERVSRRPANTLSRTDIDGKGFGF